METPTSSSQTSVLAQFTPNPLATRTLLLTALQLLLIHKLRGRSWFQFICRAVEGEILDFVKVDSVVSAANLWRMKVSDCPKHPLE